MSSLSVQPASFQGGSILSSHPPVLEEHGAFIKTAVLGRLTPFFQGKVDPAQELRLEELEREGKLKPFLLRCEEDFASRFSETPFPYQALLEEYLNAAIAHVNKKRGLILIADVVDGHIEYSPQATSEEEEKAHFEILTRSLQDAVNRDFNGLKLESEELRTRIRKDLSQLHQQLMYKEAFKLLTAMLNTDRKAKSYDPQDWFEGIISMVEQNFRRVIDEQNRADLRDLIESSLQEKRVTLQ